MKPITTPDWRFLQWPAFSVFEPLVGAQLAALSRFPRPSELANLARGMPSAEPLRFEFALQVQSELEAAGGFDKLIASSDCIPTRADSYHDLLGALVWLHFPQAKTALHRIQLASPPFRGAPENAATHLDESGVLVLSSELPVFEALAGLRWRELFWERRNELCCSTRFWVFGHGLLDSLRAPHPRLMGKALFVRLDSNRLTLPDSELRRFVDCGLAARLKSFLIEPARLFPLPVLGVPGWHSGQCAAFYDDKAYFRTLRRRPREPGALTWLELE